MSGEINKRIQELKANLSSQQLAKEAYKVFVKNTPIKTGNARHKTTLKGDEIQASYPYAVKLNEGSSKQNPEGMSAPTDKFIQDYIKKQSKG